jgi:moderate conductance mechanosensitive channel
VSVQVLAQSAEQVTEVCGRGEDAEPDLLCELLLEWTGNEVLARAAGVIEVVLRVLVLLVLAYVLARLLRGAVSRFGRTMERRIEARLDRGERLGTLDVERYRIRRFQRLHAAVGVLRGVAGAVVWTIALFAILDAVGVPLQPILAGAGLAGIVLGFGAQQLVRDVLAGIAMLVEDQYGVGDWIEVDGRIGQVERVGIRATSFRDLDGIMNHVLNGYLQRVGNLSQEWSRSLLDVPLALDSDVPTAKAIIHKVATELSQDPVWAGDVIGPPEIWGVQDFGPDGLTIRLVMPTKPMANWDINRQLRERLHHAFALAGIRMQGRLVELGGMQRGYPVITRDEGPREAPRRARRGLVPTDVGPLDRPPGADRYDEAADHDTAPQDVVAHATGEDEGYQQLPDRTAELRLQRGPQPRPD